MKSYYKLWVPEIISVLSLMLSIYFKVLSHIVWVTNKSSKLSLPVIR